MTMKIIFVRSSPINDSSQIPRNIEPTRSEMEARGFYSGNPNADPGHIINVSKPNVWENFKTKCVTKYTKLEKKYEKSLLKEIERKRQEQEYYKSTYYIKKENSWLSNAELRSLHKQGLTVKNSKIVKIPAKPNKTYY